MQSLNLWHSRGNDEPRRFGGRGPIWFSAAGLCEAPLEAGERDIGEKAGAAGTLLIAPREVSRWIAYAIVPPPNASPSTAPPRSGTSMRLNGVRLPAGLHVLDHGDCLECGDQRLWAARGEETKEVAYDPAAYGENVFCAHTKARLKPGTDLIVICPGAGCRTIYKAEAWRLRLPCHVCQYDPRAAAWQPPRPQERTLDVLLELITTRGD